MAYLTPDVAASLYGLARGGTRGEIGSRRPIDLNVNVTEYVNSNRRIRYTSRKLIDIQLDLCTLGFQELIKLRFQA
jgi:hypothetical protein